MNQIPAFKLQAIPLNAEAAELKPFTYAAADIGKRHKLGGYPDKIDEKFWPQCCECNKKMTFYGQLDSINDQHIIADCGVIQIYYCFDCVEVTAQIFSA